MGKFMNKKLTVSLFLFAIAIFSNLPSEESKENKEIKKESKESKESHELKEEVSVTTHSVKINGKEISYNATAGNLLIKDNHGKTKASVAYVAYVKTGEETLGRPITFCFNGGPGSSAVWLHIGALGPRRIVLNAEMCPIQPYQVVDNDFSILDATDLVFIDPVSTGYSRAAHGEDLKQFHGVKEDIKSVAEFIRLYTTRFNRWGSPKFLAGESYGTVRAAGLAEHLHEEHHLDLNGIILISSVLNFQTLTDANRGNDLPYILSLPSYTAAAWYHKKLPVELQENFAKTLAEVQDFAIKDYNLALMQGDTIDKEFRNSIISKLSRYTGLTPEYIDNSNLRVNTLRFIKELLRKEKRTIGRFDSRLKGIDSDSCGQFFEYDPSLDSILGGFTAGLNDYLRSELKWEKDESYKILSDVHPWNYGDYCNQYVNVAETLREMMTRNPKLFVFVGSGYFDLATPYFATEYTFSHLGLDPSLRDHVTEAFYQGGHMMYTELPELKTLNRDIVEFITSACQKARQTHKP